MGAPEENKFHIGLLVGIFASQPIGREILLRLARHILEASNLGLPLIKKILDRILFRFFPGIDPDFEKIPDNCNPTVADEVGKKLYASNKKQGQLDIITSVLENMLRAEGYDAIILLGGSNRIK